MLCLEVTIVFKKKLNRIPKNELKSQYLDELKALWFKRILSCVHEPLIRYITFVEHFLRKLYITLRIPLFSHMAKKSSQKF